MAWEWQKNQNGTHFAERGSVRISVKRSVGIHEYAAKIGGELIGLYPTLQMAKHAAEYNGDQRSN